MNAMSRIPGFRRAEEDEIVLWRGSPCWRSLARTLCHVRGVALYVALVVCGTAIASVVEGATPVQTAATVAPFLLAGLAALGFLYGLAWRIGRTTEYTLTSHRLIMRFGVALPAVLAIPHRGIARAAVAVHGDGTGDLPLIMQPGFRVTLHRVWPHSRPWRFIAPQPMLRSVPNAGQVATLLVNTLAEAAMRDARARAEQRATRPMSEAVERGVLQAAEPGAPVPS